MLVIRCAGLTRVDIPGEPVDASETQGHERGSLNRGRKGLARLEIGRRRRVQVRCKAEV
jgi:hypothetical protein